MKITFINPGVGRKEGEPYVKLWQMEPLSIAALAALTPREHTRVFYDDRLEKIPFDEPTDLVAITAETYTARRAYQIAAEFRKRGVPVVMGGFHPTLVSGEAREHADAVVIGQAEGVWAEVLSDAAKRELKGVYGPSPLPPSGPVTPDRSVFAGKKYLDIALVETARGCRFDCEFCSIASFYRSTIAARPVKDVVNEVRRIGKRLVFFVDDNIAADPPRARELFTALIPLKIRWAGQVSCNIARDPELLSLMRRSGCLLVLVGFESLDSANLKVMGKTVNRTPAEYESVVKAFRRNGISLYATFVFGYDNDTAATIGETCDFAIRNKFFFAALNHLVPFPGTRLYERFRAEGRLGSEAWWLSPEYMFGDVAFRPRHLSPRELSECCLQGRRRFYSAASIVRRSLDLRANCATPFRAFLYFTLNAASGREIGGRHGLPLGVGEAAE